MSTDYQVVLKLTLRPIGSPWVRVAIDDHVQELQLETLTTMEWDFDANDSVCLSIEHFNKHEHDPSTAVEIVGISFFNIEDPKFAWAGIYRPDYPKLWYSEQKVKPAEELFCQTYLGWNGVYSLKFDVPVFTWIHKVQDLGWIYQ